jgi:hypothetical protein
VVNRFATWVAQDSTPARRVLLTMIHAVLLSGGTFLLLSWMWFCFWMFSGGIVSFPWRWVVPVAVTLGVVGAHGLWRVRRKQWTRPTH